MNIGMLWFDNDPKSTIDVKIGRAVSYYRNKYGQTPNLCFIHPSMVKETKPENEANSRRLVGEVELRTSSSVLPNHFWIGRNGLSAAVNSSN